MRAGQNRPKMHLLVTKKVEIIFAGRSSRGFCREKAEAESKCRSVANGFLTKKSGIFWRQRKKVITIARKKYVSNSSDDLSQEREWGEAI